jgi:hypothetical protein
MGNVRLTPIYKTIPEAIPLDDSEIKRNAKKMWYTLHDRAAAIDNKSDQWVSQYEHILVKKPWTLSRFASYVPGLGTAMGIFGVYCALEQLGLYDDGGWRAWTEKKHH